MPKTSAGLLMYRRSHGILAILLVHPGGPFWVKKDKGAWGIPKGECNAGETTLDAAVREFREETGYTPEGPLIALGTIKQGGGKSVAAWAVEGDFDPAKLVSNTCRIEWPPRSGRVLEFAEVDQGRWFSVEDAQQYMLKSQLPLVDALCSALTRPAQS